jgi:hypothetical protein
VSSVGPPAGPDDDAQALEALAGALDQLGAGNARRLAEVAVLMRAFPCWAAWLSADGRTWTAARPAGSMPPGPEAPMVWVRAETVSELAERMRAADAALLSPDGF